MAYWDCIAMAVWYCIAIIWDCMAKEDIAPAAEIGTGTMTITGCMGCMGVGTLG